MIVIVLASLMKTASVSLDVSTTLNVSSASYDRSGNIEIFRQCLVSSLVNTRNIFCRGA